MKKTYETKSSIKNGIKRLIFISLSFIIETAIVVLLFTKLVSFAEAISIAMRVLGVVLVLYIYGQPKTSAMKTPWIIAILAVPIFGTALFLTIGLNVTPKRLARNFLDSNSQVIKFLMAEKDCYDRLKNSNKDAYGISHYIYNYAKFPVYDNSGVRYFSEAADGLNAMIEDLKRANEFIFMEYFAIENSISWKRVEDILVEKVNAGVEVRVFYDDIGSISFVNLDFAKHLNSLGIKCRVFNPCVAGLKLILNHRDHRKITVIDGKVAYTGGFNLADEYFGVTHPFGMWKDTGIRIEGNPVNSYTVAFLGMWNFDRKKKVVIDVEHEIEPYLRHWITDVKSEPEVSEYIDDVKSAAGTNGYNKDAEGEADTNGCYKDVEGAADTNGCMRGNVKQGFIQPYADAPLDHENLGEEVYIGIINSSTEYCYFMTPYLIITDEMLHAIRHAAKRGVDVRIVTPGIPDKKLVYRLTRSYYNPLIKAGVRIYEWTPGFCHAKVCVSDDSMATCGTINLDYRSLYHNFEDGCLMIDTPVISDIRADFEKTFEQCTEVTRLPKYNKKQYVNVGARFLRLFAELM